MKLSRALLGLLPFVGILAGAYLVNRVEPFVLGMPFLLFWIAAWTVLTAVLMALVYRLDPRNRRDGSARADKEPGWRSR
ncbi:MAG TPA: DUF3311 domain-containing protein [Gammaproteobacteria bacterium]|nr:DUF3311 domain-containing protein [Gammaproteobacteria bacterium]